MWSEPVHPAVLVPDRSVPLGGPADRLAWPKAALVVAALAGGSWTTILLAVAWLVG